MSLFDSIRFPLPLYGSNRYLLRGAGSLSIWKRVDKKLFKVKKEKKLHISPNLHISNSRINHSLTTYVYRYRNWKRRIPNRKKKKKINKFLKKRFEQFWQNYRYIRIFLRVNCFPLFIIGNGDSIVSTSFEYRVFDNDFA